jgi:predicted lipoprotein
MGAWLVIDRPWTIRPIGQQTSSGPFDAVAYVDGIWASRVVPQIEATAVAVAAFLDASTPGASGTRTGAVGLEGVILSVDTASRVGVVLVDVDPIDGRADASMQIGPVLRGTALRDALDFIRFTDFTNQIEFAAVAGALNDRVRSGVLGAIDVGALEGRRVRAIGAASHHPNASGGLPSIVPVRLVVEDR